MNIRQLVSQMESAGTSEGATKGWDTRGGGETRTVTLKKFGYKADSNGDGFSHANGSFVDFDTNNPNKWYHGDPDKHKMTEGEGKEALEQHLSQPKPSAPASREGRWAPKLSPSLDKGIWEEFD